MTLLKHITLLGLAGGMAFAAHADAEAQRVRPKPIPSWYVGLAASVNYVGDAELDNNGGVATTTGDLEFGEGYGIHGVIGYKPRYTNSTLDFFRFEAELSLRDNAMDEFVDSTGVTPVSDDLQVQTAMVNMFVDFNSHGSWRPYLGVGVGAAKFHLDSVDLGIDDEDTVFAYQGMVGIYYSPPSFPAAEFGVGYRYLDTSEAEFANPTLGGYSELDYESHSLELGSRFYF